MRTSNRSSPARKSGWTLAPVLLADQARVALGDEAGEFIGARAALVLIGERPGLSSPDSLGAYLTWAPLIALAVLVIVAVAVHLRRNPSRRRV